MCLRPRSVSVGEIFTLPLDRHGQPSCPVSLKGSAPPRVSGKRPGLKQTRARMKLPGDLGALGVRRRGLFNGYRSLGMALAMGGSLAVWGLLVWAAIWVAHHLVLHWY